MTKQELTLLRVWVEGERKALEWTTREGRTFQILGVRGSEGCYERFLDRVPPTRRRISDTEVMEALQNASSPLELYWGQKGSGRFFQNAEEALVAAKAWIGK